MLSINGPGHGWRCLVCKAIQKKNPDGHDYDDDSVIQLFADGRRWASENRIPVDASIDHASAFIASRDSAEEPVIPEFMRRYCAHVTATSCSDARVSERIPMQPRTRAASRPRPVDRAQFRRAPSIVRM